MTALSAPPLPPRVQAYVDAIVRACATSEQSSERALVSVVLFGSAAGTLKRSVHNCLFCYHMRPALLQAEVEFL